MLEHERSETAALVDRQSSEMLELISARRSEYMQNESIFLDDEFAETLGYPDVAPPPTPPAVSKFQIYTDPIEFEEVDRIAISVRKKICLTILRISNRSTDHFLYLGGARGSENVYGPSTSTGRTLYIGY